jgi:hypothetical protein
MSLLPLIGWTTHRKAPRARFDPGDQFQLKNEPQGEV